MTPSWLASTMVEPFGQVGTVFGGGGRLQSSAFTLPSPLRSVIGEPSGHVTTGGVFLQSSAFTLPSPLRSVIGEPSGHVTTGGGGLRPGGGGFGSPPPRLPARPSPVVSF